MVGSCSSWHQMEVSGQLNMDHFTSRGWTFSTNWWLDGCQSWSGHFREEKNLYSPARNQIWDHPALTETAESCFTSWGEKPARYQEITDPALVVTTVFVPWVSWLKCCYGRSIVSDGLVCIILCRTDFNPIHCWSFVLHIFLLLLFYVMNVALSEQL